MLKGFQLLFVPPFGREPRVGYGRACYFPADDPFNQERTYTARMEFVAAYTRRAVDATRGLHLSSTIFIIICKSERGRVCRASPPDVQNRPRQMTTGPRYYARVSETDILRG